MTKILVTGGAGFIGSHLSERLLERGDDVRILDNFDRFYARSLKVANLENVRATAQAAGRGLEFVEGDIRDADTCERSAEDCEVIVHLAALAGVRPSLEEPARYWDVNLVGLQNLLSTTKDASRRFVFGSSSSVYGGNEKVPFSEADAVEEPVSPYAATKRAGELCCYTHHELYGTPISCLRFFTVYGPRQRPEMAIHKFTRLIENGQSVPMFGDGSSSRDYTYVDDIVDGVMRAIDRCGEVDSGYRIYNLGGSATTSLAELIDTIGDALGKKPDIEPLPFQPGDVPKTFADVARSRDELGYEPKVPVSEGIRRFVKWYREAREHGELEL
ncbi:MAG: GDP-mannose 4,6-dehydratase [Planctomycetes bacterium]|nr:GDP-mannose 4,6-dehydratase [Planctomycetota bacterium]MCB9918104.1 GDP-mannose 4,6-dehydratase [Planctomycetota bacterium]